VAPRQTREPVVLRSNTGRVLYTDVTEHLGAVAQYFQTSSSVVWPPIWKVAVNKLNKQCSIVKYVMIFFHIRPIYRSSQLFFQCCIKIKFDIFLSFKR